MTSPEKRCRKCSQIKSPEDFYKNKRRLDGLNSYCKKCDNEDTRLRRETPSNLPSKSETERRSRYKRLYGITLEEYDDMLLAQGGKCPICERDADTLNRRLAVDHNHKTGEIRGLLCTYCNHRVIGQHRDPEKLRKMADYLDNGTGRFVPEDSMKRPRRKRVKKSGK